ncbi:MAG: cytochrome, partial [Hyphomicrobiales bacterium]|nr:cytochrome [Hyphomicrobiales bacterium]
KPPFYVFNNGPPQVIVGRYADVQEMFRDAIRFSSEVPLGKGYEQFDRFIGTKPITQMEGEAHARLRRLMMPAFSGRRVEQIEERIRQIIGGMLDEIERSGPAFDAMGQYAARLIVGVLLTAMLNLDDSQKQALMAYQEVQPLLTSMKAGQAHPPEVLAAHARMREVVEHVIADRRSNPRSDFLGDLVQARDQGDRLNDVELFDQIFGIFGALATTPRTVSGAFHAIYSHPEQSRQLVQDPALLPDAIEECLRFAGNGYFTFPRIATCDTELGGTTVLKGMILRPSPQAANYDPTVFENPLTFDIHRKPQRIMTFGTGPHHCIGHVLGRKTLQLALGMFMARFPGARLADPDFIPEYGGAAGELRTKSLPMLTH